MPDRKKKVARKILVVVIESKLSNDQLSLNADKLKNKQKPMQKRGQLTDRIKAKSKEILGYEISQTELRLMVYVQYVMVNEQRIDPNKISAEERVILSGWRKKEFIEGGASGLAITKEFWDAICEIVFLGYVDLSE